MLSKTAQYAVKALIHLAQNSHNDKKILAADLAGQIEVPSAFLAKILQQLSVKGYVSSAKGPNGGFYLSQEQLSNSIYDIILEVEGRDIMGHCALNLKACNEQNPCALHEYIVASKSALKASLVGVSLKEMA